MARGHIRKRGKYYYVRYDAGIGEDGRRKQPSKGGFLTEREAEEYLAQRLAEVVTGRHVAPTKTTFGAFAAYWLDTVMPGTVRATSHSIYRMALATHLVPAFGPIPLQALKAAHIHRYYRRCEAAGMAPRTIRGLHARLCQILRVAVREQLVTASVMADVKPPRIEAEEMRVWTPAQLAAFLDARPDDRFRALWHVYAMTGMRRGEALGLRWKDVDWEKSRLHVRQQAVAERSALALTPPKNALGRRSIAVGRRTLDALAAHRARQNVVRLAMGARWTDLDLVFGREPVLERKEYGPGTPYDPRVISQTWRRVVATTDLPPIRLHDLRHTHASILLAEDGNVKGIAARLGHDPAVLLRVYAHIMDEHQERAVSRFEAALDRGREWPEMARQDG